MIEMIKFISKIQRSPWYAGLLITLAVLSGLILVCGYWPDANSGIFASLMRFDFYVACFFMLDFLLGWLIVDGYRSRWDYFRQNWMNLVSSVPVTNEFTQLLRLLRIWRAWRVLRVALGVLGVGWYIHTKTKAVHKGDN